MRMELVDWIRKQGFKEVYAKNGKETSQSQNIH